MWEGEGGEKVENEKTRFVHFKDYVCMQNCTYTLGPSYHYTSSSFS